MDVLVQGLDAARGPAKLHGRAATSEAEHCSLGSAQRAAAGAVVVGSYFREGPFCILKRGLGFSLASAGDPGATAAPRGLVQACAPSPAPMRG